MSDKKVIEGRLELGSVFPTGRFNPIIIQDLINSEGDKEHQTDPLSHLLDANVLKDFVGKKIRITIEEVS
jgi:hypothetical protein